MRADSANSSIYRAVPPPTRRGLSRIEAAEYVGVGASKFDQLVNDGRMPNPKRIDGRKVWDVRALDMAFDALPAEGEDTTTSDSWSDI